MQSVSLFKVPEDGKASPFGEVAVNALALLVHTDGNDVQMMAVDVLMLDNDIRLVAITHALHILMRHLCQFPVRQPVIRMGIERDMDYRLFRPHLSGHPLLEVCQHLCNIDLTITVVEHLVSVQQLAFPHIHLVGVILDGTEKGIANRYLCNHLSLASFANATICCPCSIIWRVIDSRR